MKLKFLYGGTFVVLILTLLVSVRNQDDTSKDIADDEVTETIEKLVGENEGGKKEEVKDTSSISKAPIASDLLEGYGEKDRNPKKDISALNDLLATLRSEIRNMDTRFISTNEDIAEVLLGKNRFNLKFIAEDSKALNEKKQIIDRWGSPVLFHVETAKEIAIRSAGPDKEMFTADDLHRTPNGVMLSAEQNLKSDFR